MSNLGITSELLWQLRLVLNGVAWQGAWDIILLELAEGKIRRGEAGRKWLNIAQDLIKAWIYETVTPLIEQRLKELRCNNH